MSCGKKNRDAARSSHTDNCRIPSYSGRGLTLPAEVCLVQLLKVTRRSRIQHVDQTAILLLSVDVFNQFIHVLVPQVGVLILEIGAHGHDDVIAFINFCLKGDKGPLERRSERVSTRRHTLGPRFLLASRLVLSEGPDKSWFRRDSNILSRKIKAFIDPTVEKTTNDYSKLNWVDPIQLPIEEPRNY